MGHRSRGGPWPRPLNSPTAHCQLGPISSHGLCAGAGREQLQGFVVQGARYMPPAGGESFISKLEPEFEQQQ